MKPHRELLLLLQVRGHGAGKGDIESNFAQLPGVLEDPDRRGVVQQASLVQDDEPLGTGGFGRELGYVDGGDAELVAQGVQKCPDLLPALGIEQGRGFVQDQVAGPEGHGSGDGHPLLFPARQMVGGGVSVGFEVELPEGFIHPAVHLRRWDGQVFQPEGDFALHGRGHQLIVRVLEDHADALADLEAVLGIVDGESVDQHLSGLRQVQTVETAGQGGLARAVGADDGQAFPRADVQVYIAQGRDVAGVGETEILHVDHGVEPAV